MFINASSMQLNISEELLLSEIQHEFNRHYPFLKLVFFNAKRFARKLFTSSQVIPATKKINEIQTGTPAGVITIANEMKVGELEEIFKNQFNLTVQVFRKSGNLWLETTMTDNWTLLQQNKHGSELSTSENTSN